MTCDQCGHELQIGDWPMCPHGRKGAFTNIPDDIPGGMVVENGFPEPIRVYSHSEHRRLLAERGLEIRARHAGPHDKIMSNWAAGIDAVTMQNAAALLSRGTKKADPERDPREEFPITVTDGETFTYRLDG